MNIVLHLLAVLRQSPADIHGISEAYVSVCLSLFVQHHRRHALQHVHQTVISQYLVVNLLNHLTERLCVFLEIHEQLRRLVTCVGEVEDIFRLLRVEHQRVLAAPLHYGEELLAHHFVLLLEELRASLLVGMLGSEFLAKYSQRVTEVFLLQYGTRFDGEERHEDNYDRQFFHSFLFVLGAKIQPIFDTSIFCAIFFF